MDIYCLNCGEPWEVSHMYEVVNMPQDEQEDLGWDIQGIRIEECPCCNQNFADNGGPCMDEEDMAIINEVADSCEHFDDLAAMTSDALGGY